MLHLRMYRNAESAGSGFRNLMSVFAFTYSNQTQLRVQQANSARKTRAICTTRRTSTASSPAQNAHDTQNAHNTQNAQNTQNTQNAQSTVNKIKKCRISKLHCQINTTMPNPFLFIPAFGQGKTLANFFVASFLLPSQLRRFCTHDCRHPINNLGFY